MFPHSRNPPFIPSQSSTGGTGQQPNEVRGRQERDWGNGGWVGAAGGCCCCQPAPPAPAVPRSSPRAPARRWLPWPQRCVSLNASALLAYTKGRSFLHCTGNESVCFVKHTSLQLIFTLMLCLKVKIKKKIKSYLTLVLTTRV